MSTPTFFLVGAPKAGTTSLFHYLGQHPMIGLSRIKEPCYFAPEVPVDLDTAAHRQTWETYCALFAHTHGMQAVGEGSVAYLGSLNAAAAIGARIPHARILMMLRDPADRLFAHYAAARATGGTSLTFAQWVDDEQRRETARQPIFGAVWAGRYATHLERFAAVFAEAHIHVSFYEDFTTDPDSVLSEIFSFLDVDPAIHIDRSEHHNVTTVARWPAAGAIRTPVAAALTRFLPSHISARLRTWSRQPQKLAPTATDRAHAITLYKSEIESLMPMTRRDLAHWLRT